MLHIDENRCGSENVKVSDNHVVGLGLSWGYRRDLPMPTGDFWRAPRDDALLEIFNLYLDGAVEDGATDG